MRDELATGPHDKVTPVVEVSSIMERCLCVDRQWFEQYVSNALGAIWDCNNARL